MTPRTAARLLLVLAALIAAAPLVDAQRGRRGGRHGGGRRGGRSILPKALAPARPQVPTLLPKSAKRLPGSLLPDPSAPPVAGEVPGTEISLPRERSVVFWTDPRDPELEEFYFGLCDHDENSWISYREGAYSLALTREGFAYYDTDHDGRIQREEFAERYALVVDRTGSFPPPRAKVVAEEEEPEPAATESDDAPEVRSEEVQLLERFDGNGSQALELGELPPLIEFWGLSDHIGPEQLLDAIDTDGSSALELENMTLLIESMALAQKRYLHSVLSVETLLGLTMPPSSVEPDDRKGPPTVERRQGPTSQFRRLDQNGDAYIGADDLQVLQSPMHLSVRTNAVIAALDTDGDGRISRDEFLAAFE